MKSEKWCKIEDLFEKASNLSPDERISYLKNECGNDSEIFDEVVSLLEADDNIHPVLNKKASDLINIEHKLNFVGQQIGSYKIVEEIASGGMGTVFLAERSDGVFEQKVALKIIKPGLSTISIIRRFQNERQILANLQHPNIARLFDGGVTDDRRPFFTMEYVEGIPIDEYCDENKLNINERLDLFKKVCETIQYAHNNLVIHRDLKPSNILIQKNGEIKLLDFGIAKVLSAESENEDLPTITQTEIHLMTPEYSSPEQIRNSKISVSTDIYSLGLVLYKLLSGKSAHDFQSRTFNEFEKVICDQQIIKPSTIINNSISESKVFENRKVQPEKLRKILNGDLDNICLMALRKEPERRYASVEMFAFDIQRYLDDLPILARKESITYSARKFIIRHKTAVIANIALFFIINGLILFYTIQLKEQRDKANLEAKKAEQVASFLQDLFLVSDPNESLGKTITARELLDKGASKLKISLDEEVEVKSQLLNTIGKVYTNLGLYNSAEEIFLILRENKDLPLVDKSTYVETLINLAIVYRFEGKYDSAGVMLKNIRNNRDNYFENNSPLLAKLYNNLGGYYYETAQFDSSDYYYKKAVLLIRNSYGSRSIELADVMYNLGVLEFDSGNLSKSDSLYRKSLELYTELRGELDAKTATAQNELASVLRYTGKFDEAEVLYNKALETRIKIFGDNHPDVAHTLNHLSRLYYNQEQYEKAEPLVRKSLEIRENLYDSTHPEISASKSSLAGTLMGLNKYEEAEKYYRSAYEASLKKFGKTHHYTPALLSNIGYALMEQQKYDEAENAMLSALEMLDNLGSYRPTYKSVRVIKLAELYNRTNRFIEAEKLLNEEIKMLKSKNLDDSWFIGLAESELGYSLHKQNKDIQAEGLLVNGYNILKEQKGDNSSATITSLKKIVDFYKVKGRMDKVEEYSAFFVN